MKKKYMIPEIMVVNVQTTKMIAASNESVILGGEYSEETTIQSRSFSLWDDDEEVND